MTLFHTELAQAVSDAPTASEFDSTEFQKLLKQTIAIPLGFGLVSVIFFLVVVSNLLALGRWVEDTDKAIASANSILQLFSDQQNGVRGFALTGNEDFLEPYTAAGKQVAPAMEQTRQLLEDNKVQQQRLSTAYENYAEWLRLAEQTIQFKREGRSLQQLIANGKGARLMDVARRSLNELVASEQQVRSERRERVNVLALILSAGYFTLSLVFSALMAYWGRKQLRNLTANYRAALLHQQHQTEVLQRQAWLRSGQTQLANEIIGQLPLPILCEKVLDVLASYLDVAVGAIYLAESKDRLERAATYGFAKDNFTQDELAKEGASAAPGFDFRESLVGQVAATRAPLFLRDLSIDYFQVNPALKVSSGLGAQNPATVVIYPIISDDTLHAVLELGFLRPLTPLDTEFLQLISENIGAAIIAAGYRRRLHEALLEMQQLNDELQVQQEELRSSNDELEEQSRALADSQIRLEQQQAELEQSNAALLKQQDALRDKNDALMHAQHLLEQRAQELESASRYKSEFLANMSHELRTPLNSLLILSQLLADNDAGNLSGDQVKYARSIHTAGNDLLALINDVLDIAKVEAGKLEVAPDYAALRITLDLLADYFQPVAQQKELRFELLVDPATPTMLFTDQQRLEQILRNLLSNAMKFTSTGTVQLQVSPHVTNGWICFAVRDTGIGIAPEQYQQIFEPFYQVDGTASRKFGGTGLGLSISRQLAELLGGHIEVESELGVGSVFTLLIPGNIYLAEANTTEVFRTSNAASVPAPAIRAETHIAIEDDRASVDDGRKMILIIEDEPTFAAILCDLAREMNYRCLVAMYAEEGWSLAQQYPVHAILLDMKLPDQSGMSLLARFKNDRRTRHVPVHVMSVEGRSQAALNMGAVGYLLKPASREQLRQVLLDIEARTANTMKHVLVVEAAAQAEATAQLIGAADVDVVIAKNGEDALGLLHNRNFDCLIVDVELPDMKGEELLLRMSTSAIAAFPPVIVHASRAVSRDEEGRLLRYARAIVMSGERSPERLLDEVTLFLHSVESEMSARQRELMQRARMHELTLENRRILVVDDDIRNVFAMTSALEKNGAQVEIARNGIEALTKLDEQSDIDLVLMDIMMPEMDGYTAMEEIRKQSRFHSLPILAVTARTMRDDQERCLRAGANDYVAKPIDMDCLISLIRVWLPKVR